MPIETMVCPACDKEIPASAAVCKHCGKGLSGKYLLAEGERRRMAAKAGGAVARPVTAIGTGAGVLLVLALVSIPIGLAVASSATAGVAILAAGAILSVTARINQAARHHQETIEAIREAEPSQQPDL